MCLNLEPHLHFSFLDLMKTIVTWNAQDWNSNVKQLESVSILPGSVMEIRTAVMDLTRAKNAVSFIIVFVLPSNNEIM